MQNIPGSAIAVAAVLVLLLLALDAPSALESIRTLRVTLPAMTRTSKGRELEIEAVVENPGQRCRVLRIGLPFPKELACEKPILELTLKTNTERNLAKWKVRAIERGRL